MGVRPQADCNLSLDCKRYKVWWGVAPTPLSGGMIFLALRRRRSSSGRACGLGAWWSLREPLFDRCHNEALQSTKPVPFQLPERSGGPEETGARLNTLSHRDSTPATLASPRPSVTTTQHEGGPSVNPERSEETRASARRGLTEGPPSCDRCGNRRAR